MKISFYNVGHGDAIFVNFGNGGLIRDFGTLTSSLKKRVEELAHLAFNYTKRNPNYYLDAFLSHPHEDHCSGFYYLHQSLNARKIFRNTYIPWLDFSNDNSIHGYFLKIGLMYLYFISSSNPIGKRIKEWITMAPLMSDLSIRLYGVSEGCNINGWPCSGKILWPPNYTSVKDAISFLQSRNRVHNNSNEILTDNDFISHFEEELDEKTKRIFRDLYDELKNALSEINIDGSHENSSNNYQKIDNILSKIPTHNIGMLSQYSLFSLKRYCENAMLKNIDNHSIVFKIDDYALFFSDLQAGCINKIVSNHLRGGKFKLIKSAHHGSRFGENLKKYNCLAQKIIHCCGLSNSNYSGPTADYCDILLSQNINTSANDIICTDWVNNSKWVMPLSGYYILSSNGKKKITF